ncbi:MAG: hypothetical protein ABMA15_26300 [Vicinamibacterales bacterium]
MAPASFVLLSAERLASGAAAQYPATRRQLQALSELIARLANLGIECLLTEQVDVSLDGQKRIAPNQTIGSGAK